MTIRKRRILLILSGAIFLFMASFILFYSLGYTIDRYFNISQKGGLYIYSPLTDSNIFINNSKEDTFGFLNNGFFMSGLKSGDHSVLIAKNGFWPWAKTLEVRKGFVTEARAILIPENVEGKVLLKGKFSKIWGSEHKSILALQEKENGVTHIIFYLPNNDTFLTSVSGETEDLLTFTSDISNVEWEKDSFIFKSNKGFIRASLDIANNTVTASYITDGESDQKFDFEIYDKRKNEKIWWDSNTNEIFANWLKKDSIPPHYICDPFIQTKEKDCGLPVQIFKGNQPIKSLNFYPNRKDVIVIAINTGVYALEIDKRGGQLIYPIYKGGDPRSATMDSDKNIYVTDGGSLMKIYLDK